MRGATNIISKHESVSAECAKFILHEVYKLITNWNWQICLIAVFSGSFTRNRGYLELVHDHSSDRDEDMVAPFSITVSRFHFEATYDARCQTSVIAIEVNELVSIAAASSYPFNHGSDSNRNLPRVCQTKQQESSRMWMTGLDTISSTSSTFHRSRFGFSASRIETSWK
jgi:hypothetical protein